MWSQQGVEVVSALADKGIGFGSELKVDQYVFTVCDEVTEHSVLFVCSPGAVPYSELQRPCPSRNWNKHSWGPALDDWTPRATSRWPGGTLHTELGPRGPEDIWRRNLCRCQLQERSGHAAVQRAGAGQRGARALLAQQECCPLLRPVRRDRASGGGRRDRRSGVANWMLACAGGQREAAVAPRAVEAPRRTCSQVWAAQESRGGGTQRQGEGHHHCWWGSAHKHTHIHTQQLV